MAALEAHEARVNITWAGENGELPDPVSYDATDGDLLQWAAEAIRGGSIPGITADPNVNLQDFIVEKYAAKGDLPNRISIRPKTPFGVRA
jgi:hypothetical protein